ncbi:MAG: LysR substrate-binding domain-containing protein [Noviherbaspirillum sp.]
MQLRQLMYFVRIVETGSLSRAAQALHVAQPALSQQIQRLEEELQVKLLVRSVRRVVPTDAGLAVYHQAQFILKQVEATRLVAAQADSGPAGTVTIGLPWTVSSLLGLALLAEVREKFRAVRLEIVEGPSSSLATLLSQGKIEIAVLFDTVAASGLVMRPVLSEPLFLVGPPGSLAGLQGAGFPDMAQRPLLLMSRPNGIRELVERGCSEAGLRPDIAAEINAPDLLLRAVKAGLGFSVLPACGLEEPVSRGELDAVALENGMLRRRVFLGASRLFSLSPAAEKVYGILLGLMQSAAKGKTWNATLLPDAADARSGKAGAG